jgi:hypothetical protein
MRRHGKKLKDSARRRAEVVEDPEEKTGALNALMGKRQGGWTPVTAAMAETAADR